MREGLKRSDELIRVRVEFTNSEDGNVEFKQGNTVLIEGVSDT